MSTRFLVGVTLLVVAVHSGLVAQDAKPSGTLTVSGDVTTPLKLTAADLKAMPRHSVQVKEETRTTTYDGVLVTEVLKKAGVLGGELRGSDSLSIYVIAKATDGYQVVFSLGELDQALSGNEIIIADTVDGKPLFAYQGPFRMVVPKDARGARSLRMLDRIEVVRVKK